MNTLLIDSPFANLANIERALRRAGAQLEVSCDPSRIARARSIVLPGVGSFPASARWLGETGIFSAVLAAARQGSWLLGVCVGHQLLFRDSDEMGSSPGLGLIGESVCRFSTSLPVPLIGWNRVELSDVPLFDGLPRSCSFYFVNSYRAPESDVTIAVANYGEPFSAAVQDGRVVGLQFHPEKSSGAGLRILQNYLEMAR